VTLPTDDAISNLAGEMLHDPIWLNTLEDHYASLDSAKSALRDAVCSCSAFMVTMVEENLFECYRKAAYQHAKTVLQQRQEETA
jgi:hypothetical protein